MNENEMITRVREHVRNTFGDVGSVVYHAKYVRADGGASDKIVPNIVFLRLLVGKYRTSLYWDHSEQKFFVFGKYEAYEKLGEAYVNALKAGHTEESAERLCLRYALFLDKNISVTQIRDDINAANKEVNHMFTLKVYAENPEGEKADPGYAWVNVWLPDGPKDLWLLAGKGLFYLEDGTRKYSELPKLITEHGVKHVVATLEGFASDLIAAIKHLAK